MHEVQGFFMDYAEELCNEIFILDGKLTKAATKPNEIRWSEQREVCLKWKISSCGKELLATICGCERK